MVRNLKPVVLGIFALGYVFAIEPALAVAPPASTYMTISKGSVVQTMASGSDLWVSTWLSQEVGGDLLTVFGDGTGFLTPTKPRLSMGLAKIKGSPPSVTGTNFTTNAEYTGSGKSGKKASGLVADSSKVYMFVRNANLNGTGCEFMSSSNNGETWTPHFKFSDLGYCSLVNYGQAYSGTKADSYLYMFSPNINSAYKETNDLVLARAPRSNPTSSSSWQFYTGVDTSGNPTWGSLANRKSVLNDPGRINRHDVTYDAAIGRFLMTMRSRAQNGGENQFSIYEAPEPWGEWKKAYYTTNANSYGESQHLPSKWFGNLSGGKQTIHMIHAGNDQLNIQKMTITVGSGPYPTPSPSPSVFPSPTKSPSPSPSATLTPSASPSPSPCPPGDSNCDGVVDASELKAIISGYLTPSPDLTGDAKVNALDISLALKYFGTAPSAPTSLISNLSVKDPSTANLWFPLTNLKVGDKQYSDRTHTFTQIPSSLLASQWIQTANASRSFSQEPLATFILTRSATVYIAHADLITPKPAWLSDYTLTTMDIINNESTPRTFSVYAKTFPANSLVSIGPNGSTTSSMYSLVVRE